MSLHFAEDIKITSSFHKKSKPYGKIESRLANGLIFKEKGESSYFFEEKKLTVRAGEFVFLPQGSSYEYVTPDSENTMYTSINFQGALQTREITVYSAEIFYGTSYIVQNFSELWNFGTASDKYKCLSLLYDLLSHIFNFENLNSAKKRKHQLINPAIEFLRNNIYSENLKIDKLHRLCGISDTYFRKIFASRFGMSPQEYVLNKRITHSKSIIESGDYDSIKELAESVGYSDPLYFSKAFKKAFGLSPMAYKEMIISKI